MNVSDAFENYKGYLKIFELIIGYLFYYTNVVISLKIA